MSLSSNIGIPVVQSNCPDNSAPDFPKSVILSDEKPDRRELIRTLVAACGAPSNELQLTDVSKSEYGQQSVALIALATGAQESRISSLIQALKLKGIQTIAYADDLFAMPIGVRCRALLSGAGLLLDSTSKSFCDELREELMKAWNSNAQRQLEAERIKQTMMELGIVGTSEKMVSLVRWVVQVSTLSDFPVLINGETGTGKELIANALYRLDTKRNKGPFIAANCSTISSGLAESELFGHRRGAFTGAESDRKGLFRAAEGGVLFLDEIGELSPALQAKLLRALQEERVLGVGYDKEVEIDVRVIAATNRDLEAMVREGKFREDLFHRLNVLSVSIPPLRERKQDLQPLTEHFVKKHSRNSLSVNTEFLQALGGMKLSGNARQLENIVRRALVNSAGKTSLSLSDLTSSEWEQLASEERIDEAQVEAMDGNDKVEQPAGQPSFVNILDLNGWNLGKALEYCERSMLQCALQSTQGNQSQVARLMGITPRSVYNKLHKYNLRCLKA